MKVVIYGKPNCPWCVKAKDLAVAEGHEYTYIDIKAAGIDGAKLSEICGEPVSTVPQIFVDDKFIKGGFTGFNEHVEKAKAE